MQRAAHALGSDAVLDIEGVESARAAAFVITAAEGGAVATPDPELLAMKAAMEMQKEMIRVVIPEWQRKGVDKVGMGIGVNSGRAITGNLGSSRFMNYTVIGDAVNTAQRLESKAGAGEIWMNEEIYPFVHGKLEKPVRREVEIKLKGKERTINALVYKPLHY